VKISLNFSTRGYLLIACSLWSFQNLSFAKTNASNDAQLISDKTNEFSKDLMELKCNEKESLKKSKGRVERKNRDLMIWLPGYFAKESAIVFRNPSPPNSTKFLYCGGTENFDLVFENFDHDAPMLYLIENNGRKHWFHVGEESVFVTQDNQHILSLGIGKSLKSENLEIVELLAARKEEQGSYSRNRYEEVLKCEIKGNAENKSEKPFSLTATKFTNEEAMIEAFEDSEQINTSSKKAVGSFSLVRKLGKWEVQNQNGILKDSSCN
jgi:hypothetical protein